MDFGDKNSDLFSDDNKKEKKKNVFNDRKIRYVFFISFKRIKKNLRREFHS